MNITAIRPITKLENISLRQERIKQVKKEIHLPVDEVSMNRTLRQNGFKNNDLTNIEKIDLYI